MRSVINRQAETKIFRLGEENVNINHSTPYCPVFDPWSQIAQGVGSQQRIGSKITNRGLKLKFWLANKADRPNLMYRIMIGTCPRAIGGTVVSQSNVMNWIFEPVDAGSMVNEMVIDRTNKRGIKWIKDKKVMMENRFQQRILNITNDLVSAESHKLVKFWIKPKTMRTIFYEDGVGAPSNRPFFVIIVAYDSWGTSVLDTVASFAFQYALYFKDF